MTRAGHPGLSGGGPPRRFVFETAKTTEKKPSRAWIWYFAFVFVASVGVAGTMIAFNLSRQLTPEQLEAQWRKWKDNGPADYRLTYTKRLNDSPQADRFLVTVRGGKVRDVQMNGAELAPEQWPYHSMDRLFRDIERFQELDAKDKRKVYMMAIFDDQTGAIRKFVRSVTSTRQSIDIETKIEPLGKD
jgi:hypothetical protein